MMPSLCKLKGKGIETLAISSDEHDATTGRRSGHVHGHMR